MSNQINESKITYRKVGDYLIPNLSLPAEGRIITLGKWGMMHKDYLRKHKSIQFNLLVMKGILYQHCAEVEQQTEELYSRLVDDFTKAEGITEQLKAENQMLWVACMNNIRNRAEEVVYNEIIYK